MISFLAGLVNLEVCYKSSSRRIISCTKFPTFIGSTLKYGRLSEWKFLEAHRNKNWQKGEMKNTQGTFERTSVYFLVSS